MAFDLSLSTPLLIIVCTILLYLCRNWRKRPEMAGIPGYRTLPLIGLLPHVPLSLEQVIPTVSRWSRHFPDLCYGHLFGRHYVLLSSARAVEVVLSSRQLLDKGCDYEPLLPWFGSGLLTAGRARWQRHRKLITPAFHFAALDKFVAVMNRHAGGLLQQLAARDLSVPLDVWPVVAGATLNVICETAMGVRVDTLGEKASEYLRRVKSMTDIIYLQVNNPWLRLSIVRKLLGIERKQKDLLKYLLDFSEKVIENRRQERFKKQLETSNNQYEDEKSLAFIDILLDASEKDPTFTKDDIREEVDTFMFEGHDTTTSGINWALYNIARTPHVQQRIYKELVEVLGEEEEREEVESEESLSYNLDRLTLGRLYYLECAIKESLRLYPPVTFFSRHVTDKIDILGYHISAETELVINTYSVHRDPAHWQNPERYDPARFWRWNEDKLSSGHAKNVPFQTDPSGENIYQQNYSDMSTVETKLCRSIIDSMHNKSDDLLNCVQDINMNAVRSKSPTHSTQSGVTFYRSRENGGQMNARRHPYCYIPFSAGSRNCIGQRFALMEMKVMLARILRQYHVETVEDHTSIRTKMSMTLQKAGPMMIKFTKRHASKDYKMF